MPLDTFENTLIHELSDLLSAEKQFAKVLQTVAKNADGAELKAIAAQHQEETVAQAEALQQAFISLGSKPERGVVCDAAKGLVEEITGALKEDKPKGAIKDVVLIGGCLRIEHYEIAGYSSAIALARSLGKKEAVAILTNTLNQEKATAKRFSDAATVVLKASAQSGAATAPQNGAAQSSQSKAAAKPAATKAVPAAKASAAKSSPAKAPAKSSAKKSAK
ncbi:MAG TPA: DUF892 family protein [Abditibacteriaceae bacterium]|jgi:ferritin-like metal-binding protein YciE